MKSIIQSEKECFVSGSTANLEEHHIFGGSNRKWSEKYGLKVWLTYEFHRGNKGVHFDKELRNYLHKVGQKAFEEHYPELSFIKIFGKNYL